MTYCVSDIHGCFDEFMELLDKIDFKAADTMYFLGDAIDRGPEPIKCLQFIMKTTNIHMLMGNHEQLMLDALTHEDEAFRGAIDELWRDYNGGDVTYEQYKALQENAQIAILEFISNLNYIALTKTRSRKYFLVHAGLNCQERLPGEHTITTVKRQKSDYPEDMLWIRNEFFLNKGLPSYTIVFGHTPTNHLPRGRRGHSIWHDSVFKDKIGIDCGCYRGGRLAALRLDDFDEFYVEKK